MVGLTSKREAVNYLEEVFKVSERRACRVINFPRTTKRYKRKVNNLNEEISIRLRELSEKKKRFGCPRLHQLLLKEGFKINHKRTERIYKLENLSLRRKKKRKNYKSEKRARLSNPSRINQYWAIDFISDQFTNGIRFRGLTIVDIFSRENLSIELARSLPAVRVVQVLERLKSERQLPQAIVLDNGPEMISLVLDQWAYENNVKLHFINFGKPTENAFIESFNGTFRDECLNMHWFFDLEDARKKVEQWRKEYNEENPHAL